MSKLQGPVESKRRGGLDCGNSCWLGRGKLDSSTATSRGRYTGRCPARWPARNRPLAVGETSRSRWTWDKRRKGSWGTIQRLNWFLTLIVTYSHWTWDTMRKGSWGTVQRLNWFLTLIVTYSHWTWDTMRKGSWGTVQRLNWFLTLIVTWLATGIGTKGEKAREGQQWPAGRGHKLMRKGSRRTI